MGPPDASIVMPEITFTLNGEQRRIAVDEGESLLDALRDRCGISSTKDGCQPQGQCGCCLALIDGKPKVTCAQPATKAAGAEIVTLEGLGTEARAMIANSFVAAGALQCGFCTPGIALRAWAFLEKNPEPTRDDIARALDVHLCRCTGYVGRGRHGDHAR